MDEDSLITEPLDFVRLSLNERVFVKLKGDRELTGKLHAYDSHCNFILGDAEETVYLLHDDSSESQGSDRIRTQRKRSEMLFVRGDAVVLVSPEKRPA